jgi:hypothetical protein
VTPRMYSLGCCRLLRRFWQIRICSQRNTRGQTRQGRQASAAADVAPEPSSTRKSVYSWLVHCCWQVAGWQTPKTPARNNHQHQLLLLLWAGSWLQLGRAVHGMCRCTAGSGSTSPQLHWLCPPIASPAWRHDIMRVQVCLAGCLRQAGNTSTLIHAAAYIVCTAPSTRRCRTCCCTVLLQGVAATNAVALHAPSPAALCLQSPSSQLLPTGSGQQQLVSTSAAV